MSIDSVHLAVIGAGPGGYAAAFLAADLGIDVALIDPEQNPGGVCLYRGCIPSKALLHAAKVINESNEAKAFGINFQKPQINIDQLRKWKNEVVQKLTGGLGQLTKQRKVKYIQATAVFRSHNNLELTYNDGKKVELKFEFCIIATGSYPAIPGTLFSKDKKPTDEKILDSTSALNVQDIPGKLVIMGGGYIGLELGTVYAALGTEVHVVEMTGGLLPGADRDLVSVLSKNLSSKFSSILLNTEVLSIEDDKKGLTINIESNGKKDLIKADKILISVGRKPNTSQLGLADANVELDEKGFIKINEKLQTSAKNIYAIGDCADEPMLAHKASHQGRTAVEIISGKDLVFDPAAIPAVVFTDPEIAWCGLTETDAKKTGMEIKIAKFPWAASGRALTLNRTDGLTKLIIDPESERILGFGIVGPGAGDLIAEGVLAIEMGANVSDIKLSIHPHPTLSETVMEAAEVFFGQSSHILTPKRK